MSNWVTFSSELWAECYTQTEVWSIMHSRRSKCSVNGPRAQVGPLWHASLWRTIAATTAVRRTAESTVSHVWYSVGPANTSPFTPDHIPVWLAGCAIKTSPWEPCMCLRAWVTFRLLCRHLCWHLRGYRRGTAPEPSAADDSLYPLQYAELVESHIHTLARAHTHADYSD